MEPTKSIYRKTIVGKNQKKIEKQKIKLIEFRQKHNIKMVKHDPEKYRERIRHCKRCNEFYKGSRCSHICPACTRPQGTPKKVKKWILLQVTVDEYALGRDYPIDVTIN